MRHISITIRGEGTPEQLSLALDMAQRAIAQGKDIDSSVAGVDVEVYELAEFEELEAEYE